MSDRRETSDKRETVVNVEREPPRNTTVYRERSSGTSILVGIVLAALVVVILAVFFWPMLQTGAVDGDTNVTVESPAPAPQPSTPPADEPMAPPPAPSAPAAEPPAAPTDLAPSEPAPLEPAPAPAQ